MLGKGLESLIPPQKKNDQTVSDNSTPPISHADSSVPQAPIAHPQPPADVPAIKKDTPDMPRAPSHVGTPAASQPIAELHPERELPAGDVHETGGASQVPTTASMATSHTRGIARHEGNFVGQAVFQIEVEKIKSNPHQPRRMFDDQSIRDLAASIREFGILQPLVISKMDKEGPGGVDVEYQLIAGERRLMAAKLLGLERVPAIVRRVDVEQEKLELAIIENLQRENLNPIEMARAFERLQEEFRLTQREIASRLGKSREVVANAVRLLDLPPKIQDAIARGEISESHGRLLLAVPDMDAQQKLFDDLIVRHMTTRELRDRVQEKKERREPTAGVPDIEIKSMQDKLTQELGTPVAISQNGEKGKITISFYSKEELAHILQKFGTEQG